MSSLVLRDNATGTSFVYDRSSSGYAAFAAKKAELEQLGHGYSDDGSGSLAANASFQTNTGNIHNSGKPSLFESLFLS